MKDFSNRIANLPPEKLGLLTQRLLGNEKRSPAPGAITRRDLSDSHPPLSYGQERLWFLHHFGPGTRSYNGGPTLRLSGEVNIGALNRTLSEIVRRHEILRTTFPEVDGRPVQLIAQAENFSVPVVDLTELAEQAKELETRRLIFDITLQPFDLAQGPLLRLSLIKLQAQHHLLPCIMHHIITDGWSQGILVEEVKALYAAYISGGDSLLPEPAVQYADFAIWQRQLFQGESLKPQLDYWRQQLSGDLPVLELPTDRPHPPVRSYRGASVSFAISPGASDGIKALTRQTGCTLFMTLATAYSVLLSRYTGQRDISVGTVIANRNRAELEGLIGFFVNMLAMRVDLSGEPTFLELLSRVKRLTLDAYAHQDMPFERLIEEIQPQRNLSHTPLFQVTFILQNAPARRLELPGLTLSLWDAEEARQDSAMGLQETHDLSLMMQETAQGLSGTLAYNTDIFDPPLIEQLLRHFEVLLADIAENPERRLLELKLLTESERHQILVEWNDSKTDFPLEKSFAELFQAQVERTPDAVAVVLNKEKVSYRALNARANTVAAQLLKNGMVRGEAVPVLSKRNPDFLAAVLAIWKTGGAYIPLNHQYPRKRLLQIIEQSDSRILISSDEYISSISQGFEDEQIQGRPQILSLDEMLRGEAAENPPLCSGPRDLSYVIYTSGSTGKPKGAMIEQAGMVNHLFAKITQLSLSGADVIMEMAPQSFDVCVWQFFAVLLVGGRVCIIDDVIVQDPVLLLEEFERQGVTVIEVVPSQLTSLIEAIVSAENDKPQLSAVRWMIATGEALPPELCRQWLALYPGIPMMNCYGPTECSDDVTHYFTSVPPPADVSRMSIGRRVPNMRIYVVDEALSPVAAGVHGELFAGGVGVGRGYLNDPVRTAEVFVPDPFSNEPGARLYKTGDLARYRFDRDIEFISRKDFQVKIRGFRIEIGEIEALLNQHPGVREAIVLVREYKPNDKRLVAYVVWNQEQAGQVSELRSLLKERLPGYMVPSAVVVMPQLPLTPNGKVNRAALPLPDSVAQDQTDEPPMQLTPYEEVLSGIWIEVLGIKQVSPGDNFFELGGHSLLATQLVARVRKAFDVELPLAFLFEDPTISGLARGVEAAMKSLDWAKLPPVKPVQRAGHLPLSFAQQRLWILDQLESGSPFYNCAAGIKLRGELRVAALERVCTELVRRHEVLRTAFPAVEGQPVQVISPPAPFNLPLIDLAGLPEAEREAELSRVGHENAKQPFDLARGPLLRIRLLKLHDQEHAAFLAMHHIVSDGWSMGLLINEIGELYSAYSKGQESPLPDLAIQYADFAHWQRSWLQGEMLENHLSYWRRQLSGTLPVLKLPVDRALAGGGSDSGARCSFNISQEITEQLRALSRREGVTLFMTLLAAFKTLLYRYSGQQDILVGTAIANRNRAELENIIGFFVNMLVIRASLSGNPSFNKLLAQVREVSLGAYAHQDLPFEKLVEELRPERHQSNVPIFQVAFGLQNAPAQALELPGLQLVPVDSDFETVRFDLTVWVAERNNRLIVIWRYRRDLFDQSTIARMHSHYERLLESIVAQPDSPIDSLQMLTGEEKRMRDDARRERERSNTSKLRTIRRKSVSATKEPPALENL